MSECFSLIWIDDNVDQTNDDYQNIVVQLRQLVNQLLVFRKPYQCVRALQEMNGEKVVIITSGSLAQYMVPQIHYLEQLEVIYIFCDDKARHETWIQQWSKIEGIFTSIKPIYESLMLLTRHYDQNAISMSFISKQIITQAVDEKKLDALETSFLYLTLFKDIELMIHKDDNASLGNLIDLCQKKGISNSELDYFESRYKQRTPIWWYTHENFLYNILNYALKIFDIEVIIKMNFFIRRLHLQLEQLHNEQSSLFTNKCTLFRGQGFSPDVFQRLCNTIDGFLSFNNFLSTSTDRNVAMKFAEQSLRKSSDMVGVLFIMTINPENISPSTGPFAFIDNCSAIPVEKEIVFSLQTIFRIDKIKVTSENSRLWQVKLTLINQNDPLLTQLMTYIRDETKGTTGWYRMGKLMLNMNDLKRAEKLYYELYKTVCQDDDKVHIINQLGMIKYEEGQYRLAASFYEKCLDIKLKTIQGDNPVFVTLYNNLAMVYDNLGDYLKALELYKKSHRIMRHIVSPTHKNLAYSYSNIGQVYSHMGNYLKALDYFEKDLEIMESTVSSTDLDLGTSCSWVGLAYQNMGFYPKALELYQKALKIREKSLPNSHFLLANSYRYLGRLYNDMGHYGKALTFYEKYFEISITALSPNHPDIASAYNGLGRVYRSMKDYEMSLSCFQKCIEIYELTLPDKHPYHAIVYSDLGDIYRLKGDIDKAFCFHRMALNIQETVQCNPLERATTYVNLGETYREVEDYSMSLTYFQNGLEIREKNLTKTHPDVAVIYHCLSKTYLCMQRYDMANETVRIAIDIAQQKLSPSHPYLIDYGQTLEDIQNSV